MRKVLLLLCALSAFPLFAQVDGNTFDSPLAGLSLTKPATWHFISFNEIAKNREAIKLDDPEFQKLLQQATAPLVVMTKHEEPYDGLNPSVQVTLRPLPDSLRSKSATEILALVLPTLRSKFGDFTIEKEIAATTVSGLPAAEIVGRYTLKTTAGGSFPVRSRLVVVPRGTHMFLIGMAAAADADAATTEELASIFGSLRLKNQST